MTLPNAPITEAVLEVIVELPEGAHAGLLSDLQAEFAEFTKSRQRVQVHVESSGGDVRAGQAVDGVLLESEATRTIVHARLDGFAVSKLKPYPDWVAFREEAMGLWERYRQVARPTRCLRLGLRYVNHVDIDLAGEITDVLTMFVVVPRVLAPAGLTEVSTVFTAEYPEHQAVARVALYLPPARPEDTKVVAVLDIDAFRGVDVSPDDPSLWDMFDRLREVKNLIFFNSITQRAMKRYEA